MNMKQVFVGAFALAAIYLAPATCQSNCTTVLPAFGDPGDGTSTVYKSTRTFTSRADCGGCTPTVSTFSLNEGFATSTTTITKRVSTSTVFVCKPSRPPPSDVVPPAFVTTATQSALPPVSTEASTLINELRTVILLAGFIANDNDEQTLCSVVSPAALFNITGINGTAVKRAVCNAASVQLIKPNLLKTLEIENQNAISILQNALFAVQVAGALQGGLDLKTLCDSIDEVTINKLSTGFVAGTGTSIKNFVCNAAKS